MKVLFFFFVFFGAAGYIFIHRFWVNRLFWVTWSTGETDGMPKNTTQTGDLSHIHTTHTCTHTHIHTHKTWLLHSIWMCNFWLMMTWQANINRKLGWLAEANSPECITDWSTTGSEMWLRVPKDTILREGGSSFPILLLNSPLPFLYLYYFIFPHNALVLVTHETVNV